MVAGGDERRRAIDGRSLADTELLEGYAWTTATEGNADATVRNRTALDLRVYRCSYANATASLGSVSGTLRWSALTNVTVTGDYWETPFIEVREDGREVAAFSFEKRSGTIVRGTEGSVDVDGNVTVTVGIDPSDPCSNADHEDTYFSLRGLSFSVGPENETGTIVVDDDGGPGADYTAIQPAVDAAAPGAVVEVREGTYRESIRVNESITIRGPNAVVDGTNLGDTPGLLITGDDAAPTVEGLTVDGHRNSGILVRGPVGAFRLRDVTVTNTTRGDLEFDGHAIKVTGASSNWSITDSTVRNNEGAGISVNTEGGWRIENTTVRNNGDDGIEVEGSVRTLTGSTNVSTASEGVGSWTISGVTVADNRLVGISVDDSSANWTIRDVTVTDTYAIIVGESLGDWTVRDSVIDADDRGLNVFRAAGDWTVRDVRIASNRTAVGIRRVGEAGPVVTGNWTIRDARITAGRVGISMDTRFPRDSQSVPGNWTVRNASIEAGRIGIDASRLGRNGTVRGSSIEAGGVGLNAVRTGGDWTLDDSRVTDAGRAVAARNATGNWTVRESILRNYIAGVVATNTTGRWNIERSVLDARFFDGDDATVDIAGGTGGPTGDATRNWWGGTPESPDSPDCQGNVDCSAPLEEPPAVGSLNVAVTDADADPGTSEQITVQLTNGNSRPVRDLRLNLSEMPAGWNVTRFYGGAGTWDRESRVWTLDRLDAGATTEPAVAVSVPADAASRRYSVVGSLTADGRIVDTVTADVVVDRVNADNATLDLALAGGSVRAGNETTVGALVTNIENRTVTGDLGLRVTEVPSSWSVSPTVADGGSWTARNWSIESIATGRSKAPRFSVAVPAGTTSGTYFVRARAYAGGRPVDSAVAVVTVTDGNGPPDALFRVEGITSGNQSATRTRTQAIAVPPRTVRLNASSSTDSDPDGSIRSYEWDTDGDGDTDATGRTVPYEPPPQGNGTVSLTVTDDEGATDTRTQSIGVSRNRPPAAVADVSAETIGTGVPVQFVANEDLAREDLETRVIRYEWDVGDDGDVDHTGRSFERSFDSPGTYDVRLTTVDTGGAEGTAVVTVEVVPGNRTPEADFSVIPADRQDRIGDLRSALTTSDGEEFLIDETLAFRSESSAPGNRTIVNHAWRLGDGSEKSGRPVYHAYSFSGTYEVTLTVTDTTGVSDTVTKEVEISQREEPRIVALERSRGGRTLENVELYENFTAVVSSDEPVDRVEFRLEDSNRRFLETVRSSDGRDYTARFNLGRLEDDATIEATVYQTDGDTHSVTRRVDVLSVPDWLLTFARFGNLTVSEQPGTGYTLVRYSRYFPDRSGFETTVNAPVPVVGGKQNISARGRVAVLYVMDIGRLDVAGGGRLKGKVLGRSAKGRVTVGGTANLPPPRWEFQRARVEFTGTIRALSKTFSVSNSYGPRATVKVGPKLTIVIVVDLTGDDTEVVGRYIEPALDADGKFTGADVTVASLSGTADGELAGRISIPELNPSARALLRADPDLVIGSGWAKTEVCCAPVEYSDMIALRAGSQIPGQPPVETDEQSGDRAVSQPSSVLGSRVDGRRLTADRVSDRLPSVADLGAGYVVVWSRQDPSKPAPVGSEVYATRVTETEDDGRPPRARLTDDRRFDSFPSVAGQPESGDAFAAWVRSDDVLTEADRANASQLLERFEIAYAPTRADGWAAPTLATDNRVADLPPTVVGDDGRYLVAWTQDVDRNLTTRDDRRVRYAVYDDGSLGSIRTIDDATAVDANAGGGFVLAYRTDNESIVRARLDDGTLETTDSYPAEGPRSIAAGPRGVAWVETGSWGTIRYARNGTISRVPNGNVTDVSDVELFADGGRPVVTYRAIPNGSLNATLYYRRLAAPQTWTGSSIAGGREANATIREVAVASDAEGFLTAFTAGDARGRIAPDVFATSHAYRPDLTVTARAETDDRPDAGGRVTLTYTVENTGARPADSATLAVEGRRGTLATRRIPRLDPSEQVTRNVTVARDGTGTLSIEVDPGNGIVERNESNNNATVVFARPDLFVGRIDERRDDELLVDVEIVNGGSVATRNVTVRLSRENDSWTETIPYVGPNRTATARIGVELAAETNTSSKTLPTNGSSVVRVAVDPNDRIDEADERNNDRVGVVLHPDIGVVAPTIRAYEDPQGSRIEFALRNGDTGSGPVRVTTTIGNASRTYVVSVPPADDADGARYRPVSLAAPESAETADAAVSVRTAPVDGVDAAPFDDIGSASPSIEPASNASATPLAIANATGRIVDGNLGLTLTLNNTGSLTTGEVVTVRQNGTVRARRPVAIAPGARTVTLRTNVTPSNGSYTVTTAADTATIEVSSPTPPSVMATLPFDTNNVGAPIRIDVEATDNDRVREIRLVAPDGTSVDTLSCGTATCEGSVSTTPAESSWNDSTGGYDNRSYRVVAVDDEGATDSTTVQTEVSIAGDVNGDGVVDIFDAVMVGRAWQATRGDDGYADAADLNNDGVIDIFDAVAIGRNWQDRAGV
ncbi:PKD domain-containing protein [Haloplanus rubicundus]|uniref:PKD domain-containing protein n=1 Tax=Haloplanus rubicundus TaxID=1547898 RepID=A0A345EFY3_9EURY|nr:PKD domain-containing protein [Haloplanus rubicundus]